MVRFSDAYQGDFSPDCRTGTGQTGWLFIGITSIVGAAGSSSLASAPALFGFRSDAYLIFAKGISMQITEIGILGTALFIALAGVALVAMMKR